MTRWFIGESRAKTLLQYAESVLAKYAYDSPQDRYLSTLRILRTYIPLWVEEWRGPLDKKGKPLYSQKLYKKFIRWWIWSLMKPQEGKIS